MTTCLNRNKAWFKVLQIDVVEPNSTTSIRNGDWHRVTGKSSGQSYHLIYL